MSAIAELKAISTLDSTKFQAGASQAANSAGKMQKAVGGIGGVGKSVMSSLAGIASAVGVAFSVAAVVGFGKALATEASQLKRTADAIGIGVGMMDKLGDAAEATGASSEGFQQKITKLVDSQEEAVKGNQDAIDSFQRLGVSVDELTTLAPDQLLKLVADGAQKDASAISDLNNIMGKGAAQEYYAVLKNIAQDGLPTVDKSVEASIKKFAELESKYKIIKDKIGELFMGAVVGTVQAFGGMKDTAKDDASGIEAQNRRFQKEKGLALELANVRKEASDKLAAKELADAKKLQEQVSKLQLRSDEKRMELLAAQEEKIADITVSPVQARNSLESIGGSLGGPTQQGGAQLLAERQLKQQEIIAEISKQIAKNSADTFKAIEDLRKE
jgi:hypothetical protein